MSGPVVAKAEIQSAVRNLGLGGRAVCVHSSLRSFGWVDGGADAVVDAFLDEGCTLMVPTFTYHFNVAPPPGDRPQHNGSLDYSAIHAADPSRHFTPESNELSRADMGAIPGAMLGRNGRARGNHPLNSFSATGPLAGVLVGSQTATDVYAPLREIAGLGGSVVLMGVGLESMTLIHYAEQLAGRRLFIRWAMGPGGEVVRARCGGCSNGFPSLDGVVAPVERRVDVGNSLWRAYPVRDVLELVSEAIRREPGITHCGRDGCERCADAVLGGPEE